MQYIPENNIIKGFESTGEFYINKTTSLYYGPYWTLLDGTPYTGITFSKTSRLLIPISDIFPDKPEADPNLTTDDDDGTIFNLLNSTFRDLPQPYNLILNDSQKRKDSIIRYFTKKSNSFEYFEINGQDFNLIKQRSMNIAWDRYSVVKIPWNIRGNTFSVNKANESIVKEIENKESSRFPNGKLWLNFSKIFKNNYLQYYQETITDLTTLGNEYKTSDGKEYIGPYHIHPDKGPMVGAVHVSTPHKYLYPINRKLPNQSNTLSQTQNINQTSPNYNPTPSTPPTTGGGISSGGGGGGY